MNTKLNKFYKIYNSYKSYFYKSYKSYKGYLLFWPHGPKQQLTCGCATTWRTSATNGGGTLPGQR